MADYGLCGGCGDTLTDRDMLLGDLCDACNKEDLSDFDPLAEGGGQPCERCGRQQEPWRYSRVCQGCLWNERQSPVLEPTTNGGEHA